MPTQLDDVLAVLLDPRLGHVVDLVVWPLGDGVVGVGNAAGRASLEAEQVRVLSGQNPLADTDPLAAADPAAERSDPHPPNARNSYPFAGQRLRGLFSDAGRSPDLVVVHSDAHYWPERGGHLGEHGSLSVRQSRAPFVLSGAGVRRRGLLAQTARVVDVCPTLLHAAGAPRPTGLDGEPRTDLVDPAARHVVGLLWDGANAAALLEGARRGELPAVARLLRRGLALTGGAIAEFPSVTLVNHTSALTGVSPWRHGIVHNEFFDRDRGCSVFANDASTWHTACELLRPGVRTIWELAGGLSTACVNEPIDRGADYSTFGLIRAAGHTDGARTMGAGLPAAASDPHADQTWVSADPAYAWSTQIDAAGLAQVLAIWEQAEPPALTWWNTTVTDSGHHGGGAHSPEAAASLRDADARLGVFLDMLESRGLLESTTILLTADHGSVAADPACRGDWDEALAAVGLQVRDEGYGFLYLGA
jgi:hypothetical protein